jgi:hypothetical protein
LGRRLKNRFERRNRDKDPNVPDELGWGFDRTDRTLLRIALGAALLTLLFCWLKHYKAKKPYRNIASDTYSELEGVYPVLDEAMEEFGAGEWLVPSNFDSQSTDGSLNPDDIVTISSQMYNATLGR